ncbi:unnamed protein product, partial [Amoebophrya sp. A120]
LSIAPRRCRPESAATSYHIKKVLQLHTCWSFCITITKSRDYKGKEENLL